MIMTVIIVLLFAGHWTLSCGFSSHYVFHNEPMTWAEAQTYCREKHTDLATVESMEDVERLTATVPGNHDGSAWIGLHNDPENWRWSSVDEDFCEEEDGASFRKWWSQPDNLEGRELCAYVSRGKWYDVRCDKVFRAVCYDGGANVTERYVLSKTPMTWSAAQEYCREHHTDLASVRNAGEDRIISAIVGSDATWIGLHRAMVWSNMSSSSFASWGTIMDDFTMYRQQSCVAVWYKDGGWALVSCDQALPFICYKGTSPRLYYLESSKKSWVKAQKYCREKYTDLATVDNSEDMDRLMRETHDGYNSMAWIGLYDDMFSEWRWSLKDEASLGTGEYWNWASILDDTGPTENCSASVMGAWRAFSCETLMRFICYDVDTDGPQRYVLSEMAATWSEAQSYCRQHHTDLATVRSMADNQAIDSLVGSGIAWIGLRREKAWSDQSTSSFRYWKTGEPDNENGNPKCVAASLPDSGKWTEKNCLDALPFFCYSGYKLKQHQRIFYTLK